MRADGVFPIRPLILTVHRMHLASSTEKSYSERITTPLEHTMSHSLESFSVLLDDIWHALCRAVRYASNAIATMSWPALLLTAVLMAFAISIVPLAITLFVVFMIVKLVVGGIVIGARRNRQPPTEYKD
jgi:hypothetical protein